MDDKGAVRGEGAVVVRASAQSLVGRKVERFELSEDKTVMTFHLDGGARLVGELDADCCSESWVEHVDAPIDGLTVEKVTETSAEDLGYGTRQEYDQVWFLRVAGAERYTSRGCTVEFRNSSNGYYGGWVNWRLEEVQAAPTNSEPVPSPSTSNDSETKS